MPTNPFENFRLVYDADTLIDIAFRKGESKAPSIPTGSFVLTKAKRRENSRITNVNTYLIEQILKIIQSVPDLEQLHPFYKELAHLLVDLDTFKLNLGKLDGLIPVFKKLESEASRNINKSEKPNQCARFRRQYFARVASVIKKQEQTFKDLEDARRKLITIPTIDTSLPSLVVAGYPNVGKSSLVSQLSSAKPEICEYPFTTKNIIIGVYKDSRGDKLFQLIDTPGILDRPMSERNVIEKQAILALRTISNIILYMFDPTISCGYSVDHQISLFNEVKSNFIDIVKLPWLILLNKKDLASEKEQQYVINKLKLKPQNYLIINSKDGPFDEFLSRIFQIIQDNKLYQIIYKKPE